MTGLHTSRPMQVVRSVGNRLKALERLQGDKATGELSLDSEDFIKMVKHAVIEVYGED